MADNPRFWKKGKPMKLDVLAVICIFVLAIFLTQMVRYNEEVYCCRHMARDEEAFLEGLGFDVKIVTGMTSPDAKKSHAWISVNLFGHDVHFDSVGLMPFLCFMYNEDVRYFDSYDECRGG